MAITIAQTEQAQKKQYCAAQDPLKEVRVVAGPGTGKSFAIEERVRWLLSRGRKSHEIAVVSFTRASALDLRMRVHKYCHIQGVENWQDVSITTLHALALKILRLGGLLERYPVNPMVLDPWELENIFDTEFGVANQFSLKRCENIRLDHEAFWSTGKWDPANFVQPVPPITEEERKQFEIFHGPRTQTYSCVLPGELIRQCVESAEAGVLDLVGLLKLKDLIVDEYQDLNPIDLRFVDLVAENGATIFVAGDDDQSIYSFRHASPAGV